MKAATRITPTTPASLPAAMESAPSPAPTVRSSITVSGAGSAPARSSSARSRASATVKVPEMIPEPPMIGSRIRGALMIWLSSTMASSRPTFWVVASPNRRAPTESKRKETTASLFWKVGSAAIRFSPLTSTRLLTRSCCGCWPGRWSSISGNSIVPGGGRPASAWPRSPSSTRWKVIFAVLPISRLTRSGSSMPGSCTRMRVRPWRWIVGSRTPVSSMRRRMISSDCSTAAVSRSTIACSVRATVMRPSSWLSISVPGSSLRRISSTLARSAASGIVTCTALPAMPSCS